MFFNTESKITQRSDYEECLYKKEKEEEKEEGEEEGKRRVRWKMRRSLRAGRRRQTAGK